MLRLACRALRKPAAPRRVTSTWLDRAFTRGLSWKAVLATGKEVEQVEPLVEYADDPVGFCRDVLGVDLWSVKDYPAGDNPFAGGQVEIAEAVRDHPRVSVAACYASGKTFTAACLVLWWIFTRRPAMVMTTAPTGRQVKTLLWREIRKLYKKARRRLPGRLLQTKLEISDDWWGMGFASDDPNRVAGLHEASNVLFVEDEAAGMEAEVVEGFSGITTGEDSRHLKIGNPICQSGPFFDSHMHPEESKRWLKLSIDAEDTPNVREGRAIVPGLVGKEWVTDKRHKWLLRGLKGLWETRVKGRFYVSAAEKVIPQEWIQAAQARWSEVTAEGSRDLGVDVAGGGRDVSSAYVRQGRRVSHVDDWEEGNTVKQADHVADLAEKLGVERVIIDRTGQGVGVYHNLLRLQEDEGRLHGIGIYGVGLGEAPTGNKLTADPRKNPKNQGDNEKSPYNRRSDEVQFSLRWMLSPENPDAWAIDPADKQLAEELGWREWWVNDRFLIQCTDKKKLKKDFGGSPDHADAAAMLAAENAKEEVGFLIL